MLPRWTRLSLLAPATLIAGLADAHHSAALFYDLDGNVAVIGVPRGTDN